MTRAARFAAPIRWLSLALIVLGLFILVRSLPIAVAIERVQAVVADLGPWGPSVFGLAYIIAALLFVPGAGLTLAAGVLFGPVWGTIAVSFASTTAAALAFLIARYLAREKVAAQAQKYPKFAAIDEAIGKGGAKIVAMLRLSPAVPFSLGNYLFGLTPIRFWSYVLASWIFMLPGTFMYVYLGHVGKAGLSVAAGAETARTPGEWALLVVGLIATIAVTVYVARLAQKAIRERTQIQDTKEAPTSPEKTVKQNESPTRWPVSATVLPLLAVVTLAGAIYSCTQRNALRGLFGPPRATLQEAYEQAEDSATFDHSAFDALVKKHVDADGWIDYAALGNEAAELDAYIEKIGQVHFDDLGRDEKLTLLINAYNAFTLRLILDYYPVDSIRDIPASERWDAQRWKVGDYVWSLNQIEHEEVRPKFVEPRIHFALVCAAIGCPKLRNEAYVADRLEDQLEDQTRYSHEHPRWFEFDRERNVVYLTRLYDWYAGDFEQVAGSVLAYAARYSTALQQALDEGKRPRVEWLPYDWTLNDKTNYR